MAHAMVLYCQVVTLNVAVNSHSAALLPLLMSNQFVEVKSNVFKRYTPESLFQLTCSGTHHCHNGGGARGRGPRTQPTPSSRDECGSMRRACAGGVYDADAVERFQLASFLVLIALRNWTELGDAVAVGTVVASLLPQVLILGASETLIDWIKVAPSACTSTLVSAWRGEPCLAHEARAVARRGRMGRRPSARLCDQVQPHLARRV